MEKLALVRDLADATEEVWSDHRGSISFRTAVGDGSTATGDLCSGVARLAPGGWLARHRHAAAEVYQVTGGTGIVTLDGREHRVRTGTAVYIPSNREHGIRNDGDAPLEFVYVYHADTIEDVEYVWSDEEGSDDPR